jgi:radical SAM superfamily enzyme YgiQ (UPF0313 family)
MMLVVILYISGLKLATRTQEMGFLKKNIKNEQIIKTADLIKKYRMKFMCSNMVGLPGETIEDVFETIRLNAQIKPDFPWCSIFQPYPKTELAEDALINHFFDSIDVDDLDCSFHNSSKLIRNAREFTNLHKFFYWAVKYPFLTPIIKKLIKLPPNKI